MRQEAVAELTKIYLYLKFAISSLQKIRHCLKIFVIFVGYIYCLCQLNLLT